MGEGEKTEGEQDSRQRKIAKFTGTLEMDAALDRMVRAVNDGFSGGRVSKHELVSWCVLYFEKRSFQDCLESMREEHFDQVSYLEAVLKQAKQAQRSGGAPPDIAALLAPLVGPAKAPSVRRSKKCDQPELLDG